MSDRFLEELVVQVAALRRRVEALETQEIHEPHIIRRVFAKTSITDNTPTPVFYIDTPVPSGQYPGGGYTVQMHWLVGHSLSAGAGTAAAKGLVAEFCRATDGLGKGVNSPVLIVGETGSASTDPSVRDIGTVTISAEEVDESRTVVKVTVDLTGSAVWGASAVVAVELIWSGLAAEPVVTAA